MGSSIEFALRSDADRLLCIYEPYVRGSSATFECAVPSVDNFAERIEGISSCYPYLVLRVEKDIVGYAYAHRYKERDAYMWDAELSVYVDETHQGVGVGRKLYTTLIEILKLQNVKNVYATVTCPNVASESLHVSLGFRKVGVCRHTGYKLGAWHDVMFFEKSIGRHDDIPDLFIPIGDVDVSRIDNILKMS